MDLNKITIMELWRSHKWAIIIAAIALAFALFVIGYGFWRTIFIFACVAAGILIGVHIDKKRKGDGGDSGYYGG